MTDHHRPENFSLISTRLHKARILRHALVHLGIKSKDFRNCIGWVEVVDVRVPAAKGFTGFRTSQYMVIVIEATDGVHTLKSDLTMSATGETVSFDGLIFNAGQARLLREMAEAWECERIANRVPA